MQFLVMSRKIRQFSSTNHLASTRHQHWLGATSQATLPLL